LPMPEVPPVIRTIFPSIPPVAFSTILLTKAFYGVRIPPHATARRERNNKEGPPRAPISRPASLTPCGVPSWILEYWPRTVPDERSGWRAMDGSDAKGRPLDVEQKV
jgi:hypothetical protein